MMLPNENYLKYFPDEDLPELRDRTKRSSCLRIGAWVVIRKIMEDYKLADILRQYICEKDLGLILDLAAYSLISENNAGQYYPDYAYNHPLFTNGMHIYSDSKVSDLLQSISAEMSASFLNDWNSTRDHREKIYISYDSTNKNCQAGDLEIIEYGHPKVDTGEAIFNYSIAYDTHNKEPLFYEEYALPMLIPVNTLMDYGCIHCSDISKQVHQRVYKNGSSIPLISRNVFLFIPRSINNFHNLL